MAQSVDIVIGAKDQASKILDDVGRSVQRLSSGMAVVAAPIAAIAAAFAAITSVRSVVETLSGAGQAFGDSEDATRKLTIAIELSGTASVESMENHNALADSLQRTLNIEDEVTKGLMAQASMLGVADRKLDDVTKTAIGLATAMGTDLNEGLRTARLALDGNFKAIEKQVPAIRALATEEQKFHATLALAEKGLIQKAAASDSATQADERAMLAIGEFMESAGAAVLPLQAMAYQGLELVVTSINTAFGPALKDAGAKVEGFKGLVLEAAKQVAMGAVVAGTFIEVAWNNIGNIAAIASASVILSLETMRADAQHALTVAIPAYAVWFADNFFNIMRDAGVAVVAVFSNLGTIIGEIFANVWSVITGEQTVSSAMENIGRAAGRGLLDGFEATTQALPTVMNRALTDTEKSMTSFMATASSNIAGELSSKLEERMKAVNEALATKEKDDDKKISSGLKMNKFDTKAPKGSAESVLTATESRLLTRGRVDDPSKMVAQNTARMVEQNDELKSELYEQTRRLDSIEKNTAIELESVP